MREHARRRERGEAKAREQEWTTREQVQRLKDFGRKRGPMSDEWLQQAAPALAVATQHRFGVAEIAFESDGSAIVEGMRERRGRVNPLQAVFLQRERRKKWRAGAERMDRGAKIMEETRECELEGARGAAGLRLSFKDIHLRAALREDDRGGEAVGSGTDDAGSANHGLTRRLSRNSPRPENSVCGVQGFCNCVSPPMQYKGRTRQSKVLRKFPEAALTARLRRGGRLFYTHSFATRKGRIANYSADFVLGRRNCCGCGGRNCLVVRVPAAAAAGWNRDVAGPAKRSDCGARPLGCAAHSRELRARFGGSARIRDGTGPSLADGPAAAHHARAALGNFGSAHAANRQGISNHGICARGGARLAADGCGVARNHGGVRARRKPTYRNAHEATAAGIFAARLQAAAVAGERQLDDFRVHVPDADKHLGTQAGSRDRGGARRARAVEGIVFARSGDGSFCDWRSQCGE